VEIERLSALLSERFAELGHEYELRAASHREFIEEQHNVTPSMRKALDAAVCSGIAAGLEEASAILSDLLSGEEESH
jgi:hypothetical protein